MYRNDSDPLREDAAGLDMFVGSGIDFLSELTVEDMDRELFNSNLTVPWVHDYHLSPQNFVDFAPLAASLGPPGTTAGLDHRSSTFGAPPGTTAGIDHRSGTSGASQSLQGLFPQGQANAAAFPSGTQHLLTHRRMHLHIEACVHF